MGVIPTAEAATTIEMATTPIAVGVIPTEIAIVPWQAGKERLPHSTRAYTGARNTASMSGPGTGMRTATCQ
jgi:hypothetical protein